MFSFNTVKDPLDRGKRGKQNSIVGERGKQGVENDPSAPSSQIEGDV